MSRFLILALLALIPWPAFAAGGFKLAPMYATHSIGEVFEVRVLADSGGTPVSAAEAEIGFESGALEVVSVSSEGSLISTFSTAPRFSNEEGKIRFAGWMAKPFSGNDGLLLTITFKSLRNMAADVRFSSGALLSSDSRGSNVLERMASALYSIGPREIAAEAPGGEESGESAEGSGQIAGAEIVRPEPPVIASYEARMEEGERILVRGTSIPGGLVTIYVTKDDITTQSSVVSTGGGDFTFASGEEAQAGVYRIAADVETNEGVRSERSERVVITVASRSAMNAAAAAFPAVDRSVMVAALALLGLILASVIYRRLRPRKKEVAL